MISRYRAWIVAVGLLVPITVAACGGGGQSASPAPAHTVKKGAEKTKHVVKEAVRKPVHTTKKVAKKTAGTVKKSTKRASGSAKKVADNTKNAVRHTARDTRNSVRKSSHTSSSSSSKTTGNVTAGAKLYASTCESCHGKGGIGTAAAPRLATPSTVVSQFGTESSLEAFIAHNMPADNPGSLTATQAHNAAAYVWHLDIK